MKKLEEFTAFLDGTEYEYFTDKFENEACVEVSMEVPSYIDNLAEVTLVLRFENGDLTSIFVDDL